MLKWLKSVAVRTSLLFGFILFVTSACNVIEHMNTSAFIGLFLTAVWAIAAVFLYSEE